MCQKHSSKYTSININILPAIYHKLNWQKILEDYEFEDYPLVYDIGCGRYTEHIAHFLNNQGFDYRGNDPNWTKEMVWLPTIPFVTICTNVLNVIDDAQERAKVQHLVRNSGSMWFISVYEGDLSGKGRETKPDCWQENRKLETYRMCAHDVIKHGIMTNEKYLKYIL